MWPLFLPMEIFFGILFLLPNDIVTPEVGVLLFVSLALIAGILWITWLVFYRRH